MATPVNGKEGTEMADQGQTPAVRKIRAWIRARIQGETHIRMPDLAADAAREFLSDHALMENLFGDSLKRLIYNEVQQVCASTRGVNYVIHGDEIVTDEEFKRRAERMKNRWALWLEHNGKATLRLWEMRKTDLLAAAEQRERRSKVEMGYAMLWRRMAANMETDEETVGQRFTYEEIEQIRRQVTQEVYPNSSDGAQQDLTLDATAS